MRLALCLLVLVLSETCVKGQERPGKGEWVDLFPGEDLKGWKRVPIAPDTKLSARNPWKVKAAAKILECDGVGIKEMLLHETERENGVFHVEWRFRKVADKMDYNSGIYVRTTLDGTIWHQAQVAHQDKAPRYADLFGETLSGRKPKRFLVEGTGAKQINPPGEWNTYEITFQGPRITVQVNGKTATTWNDCQVSKGFLGLQAEYYFIEFKNLKYRKQSSVSGK